MCLICKDLDEEKITVAEARRNLAELRVLDDVDPDHYPDIIEKIRKIQESQDNEINKNFARKKL